MTFSPLLHASFAVQLHVATVIPAAILGAFLLARPKGTRLHRLLGKIWLALMVVTAFSTFFIHEIKLVGGFSPIHLLSIYVLFGSWQTIAAARRHDIPAHRGHVAGMYLGGIVVAGLFTLLPGRLLHASLFSELSIWQSAVMAALLAALLISAAVLSIRQGRLFGRRKSSKRLA
ncbi:MULTISPECIES: DUF2306 domain-containing protein [Ensifer]|jgi:uncharacterized membrane protein|uniref:DUF2306 domain-containing protein n=1 Tax=Ensifer canadensis TaxID=555315 RepID=A0AAW4FPP5_9HYPH|nr:MULTISPECIES: DUF2306 domain-containing protein [Ensifer]MDP9630508.1 putative membrane protein [Ensifer adhaerens]KQU85909.1 hypothetical protein ASD00_05715 [Ensifer sp. Root31]KQW59010.1 hypothetical protein ASD02_08645 [Ensifer sp. Root1252]KRC67847.1 hypothetical protein ASE32_12105 [Ensifer sp. Root231]KRC98923.1 hypothetical protein ASE47_07295 [Ensifer sp. Root258]